MEDCEPSNTNMRIESLIDCALFFTVFYKNARATSMLILDAKGVVMSINLAFERTFGYSKSDITGKNYSLLFTREDQDKGLPQQELKKALTTGSALDNNYIVHMNGKQTWVSGESIYINDEKGKDFIIKIIHDIDEQKKLEETLRQKNEEQKKIINDRDTFVYAVSHDLVAPINNIEGLVKYVLPKANASQESKSVLDMIIKSVEKFRNTLKELSNIGKEQEEEKISAVEIDIEGMYEEIIIFNLDKEIKKSQATINSDFQNAPIVKFSAKNFRSILTNLLSNAIKYRSPDRHPVVTVKTQRLDDTYVLLTVEDNGLGIKKEEKEKVFQMYGRIHKHVEGTGVGLSIVKRMVENSGGKIDLESTEGKGSTFKVYFPI